MKVLQFPLVKITFWFVLGILCSYNTNIKPTLAFGLLFGAFLFFIIGYFIVRKSNRLHTIFGIVMYLLVFTIGVTTSIVHNDFYQSENYVHHLDSSDKDHQITIVLREKLKDNNYCQRYIADVKALDGTKTSGKLLVNFYKNNSVENFTIGNIIYLKTKIATHQNPKNPDQFDYGKYLTQKSIFAQVYVNQWDYKISPKIDKTIWYYSNQIRRRILTNLEKNGFKNQELNVVAALILGQKQDISPEILQDYQFAGAIHILSVSGLHVGYLLLLLNFLTNGFPKTQKFNFLKLGIIIISLWGFAVLAGLSPSVVRSVCMFSIVAIGMHLKRKTNIYNTLCISIFFILLFEPAFIFDIGFQLSYTAVFFIVWLQPIISKIWIPKYKILKYFWAIVAVTFAAQIGTLPISLYYFHQFSGLFFITNMVVLPVLGFIMILGVIVMFLAVFNIVPQILIKVLEFCIEVLNNFIHWIASFQDFIFRNIPFNATLLITLYLLIIAVAIWSMKPNLHRLKLVLIAFIFIQTSYFITISNQKNTKELIVFNQQKQTIIGKKEGERVTFMTNDSVQDNKMLQSFVLANFNPTIEQKSLQNIIYFNKNKILIIDKSGVYSKNTKPDIIIITKSPKINFERMLQELNPKIVIADASNYKSVIKNWERTCINAKIPFHATSEKGFYKLE